MQERCGQGTVTLQLPSCPSCCLLCHSESCLLGGQVLLYPVGSASVGIRVSFIFIFFFPFFPDLSQLSEREICVGWGVW